MDPRRNTPRHIIITLSKIKDRERILKAAREKQRVTYKGVPIPKRNFAGKKGLTRSVQRDESKDLQPRLLYSAKLSFRIEGQIKCFPDKVKLSPYYMKC